MPDTFTLPMLEWCDIPAGQVTILGKAHGSRAGWVTVLGRAHHVEVFRIGKYPVTYAQFQAFIDAPDGFHNDVWWRGLAKREIEPGRQMANRQPPA